MRILIDECLNWRLSRALTGQYCVSVQRMGWGGLQNGELLAMAVEQQFDIFLTGDRNLAFQQNTTRYQIAIIVLESTQETTHASDCRTLGEESYSVRTNALDNRGLFDIKIGGLPIHHALV